jgi:ACS family glucarate transporter-like MFS transporter
MKRHTHLRWKILGLLFLISVITFLDRINISIAGKQMSEELGLTDLEFGTIFSAFVLGYALFQIPGGWLGDRFGYKKVLVSALILWSLFTALTPLAPASPLVSMLGVVGAICLVRFLIGLAESVSYPCSTALAGRWFPPQERGRAIGTIFAGLGVGAALTSPIVAWLVVSYSWQVSFYVCALLGILLGLVLVFYLTERPQHHPLISESELEYIRGGPLAQTPAGSATTRAKTTPWVKILTSRDILLLFASFVCIGYTVNIYFAWFYRYLTDERGFDALNASYFAVLPFLVMTVTSPFGGWLTDRLMLRVGKRTARRMIVIGGTLPCLPLLFLGGRVDNDYLAIAFLSLGFGCIFLGTNCFWTTAIELMPSHAGTIGAMMNMGTTLAGAFSPILTPLIKNQYGWPAAWTVAGFFTLGAAILWIFIGAQEIRAEGAARNRE